MFVASFPLCCASVCAAMIALMWILVFGSLHDSAPASPTPIVPFPKQCDVINASYVDCSHRSLRTVPPGIPVTVETLDLSHNSIHIITSESFSGLVQLTTLQLHHNSVSRLHADYFRDQGKLKRLILNHNQIGKLPDDVFNYTRNMEILDLSYMDNGMTRVPAEALQGMVRLRHLTFRSNRLQSASLGPTLSLPLLESLDLGKNKITTLQDLDFHAINDTTLTCLNLTDNDIDVVDRHVFDNIRSVKSLDFSRGLQPSAIPSLAAALSGVRMENLLLRKIGLSSWNGENFQDLLNSSLKVLDLSSNQLTALDSSFTGLSSITSLLIRDNIIQEIGDSAFLGLRQVQTLDLSGNKLSSLREGMFSSLSSVPVSHLYLNGNAITKLNGSRVFSGLSELRYLKLSKNKIYQKLTRYQFEGLTSLEVLDLGVNANISLSSDTFSYLPTLQTLYLNLVKLKEITTIPSPFSNLRSLKKLDLSNNNMAAVYVDTFASLTQLDTLYLQHNNLYNMWNETAHVHFLTKLRNLTYLDLCFNGFRSIPNNTFIDQRRLQTLRLCHNKISHLEDSVFTGLSIRALDLADNQINLINKTIMEPILDSLETLWVSGNAFSCSCELRWFRYWIDSSSVSIPDLHRSLCASPPSMRNKPLASFHPEILNCDHHLPLYAWILIGAGSASIVVISAVMVKFRWYLKYYFYLINAKRKHYTAINGDDREFQYDAFVSFCNTDKDWIQHELMPRLEEENDFRLCIHERDFVLGKKIMESITEAVDSSRFTLCLLSEDYLDSRWCKMEREFAMANIIHRDVLIIIVLSDIPKQKLTRYYKLHSTMKKRTYLKWPREPGRERDVFWQKLVDVLRDPNLRVNMNNNV